MSTDTSALHFQKAIRALASAQALLRDGDSTGACNRAYYAMFGAAHAALAATGVRGEIKTHHGLLAVFGREVVLKGLMDVSYGRSLNQVQDMRHLADYAAVVLSIEQAASAVEQAEMFVAAVRSAFTPA